MKTHSFVPVATNHTIPEPIPELVPAPTREQYETLVLRLEEIENQISQQEQDNESARGQLRDLARGERLYRPPNMENRIIMDFDDDCRFYDLWEDGMITVAEHDAFVARFRNYRYHQVRIVRAHIVTSKSEQIDVYRINFSDSRIQHDQVINQTMMDFIYSTRVI